MKKDNIDKLFEELHSEFDFESPNLGHQERFLSKLKNQNGGASKSTSSQSNFWKLFLSIAASIIICLGIFTILKPSNDVKDLASVSPEMSQTQNFFTTAISEELVKLNKAKTPETASLINDAMKQMDILEKEYESLKIDLTESGNDKRVIYAMISNFQTRIDLLKNVMETIENVNQLKQQNNENQITI
ncbi:hypothetical protein GCM10007962_28760 [Yeosuana aromativorans]|uniref:DUF4179 domain-containing protein n=1 Tax=Yeosuana aromativorans TaxID=288019 RepID=A0A8J3BRX5_9FLAO|nr:hypothetical protein [Yeosuana aromativorans]GGK32640.1 hypothetical protein GCM10007962_28760 [Yeosuana aromativorans]